MSLGKLARVISKQGAVLIVLPDDPEAAAAILARLSSSTH